MSTEFELETPFVEAAVAAFKAELGEAVEQAFVDTFGREVRPVTPDMLEDICDLYEALAWAGARAE